MVTHTTTALVFVLGLGFAAPACGSKKNAQSAPSASEKSADRATSAASSSVSPGSGAAAPDQSSPSAASAELASPAKLCVDLSDLASEPLDLEALQDEMPSVDISGVLGDALQNMTAHGTPVPLDGGNVVVPLSHCKGDSCELGIAIFDQSGAQRALTILPGLDAVTPNTELDFVTALADVNSDGSVDLWVGYQHRSSATMSSTYHVTALSLPDRSFQWYGVIRRTAATKEEQGCDGAIYPVDADCDGDGDIVQIERCGPMRCLDDEGDGNPGCQGVSLKEYVTVHQWNSTRKRYIPGARQELSG
ncbi:MAG: hypothetical protein MJE77_19600 [Proteobacteria bacterium]|nr:hypothetical protein [Pseudomonadota bacterium]